MMMRLLLVPDAGRSKHSPESLTVWCMLTYQLVCLAAFFGRASATSNSVCPHGRRGTIGAVMLSVLSYIFLCTASFGCDFMKIDGYLASEPPYVYTSSLEVRFTVASNSGGR
jgi:hypothetical protein